MCEPALSPSIALSELLKLVTELRLLLFFPGDTVEEAFAGPVSVFPRVSFFNSSF